MDKNHPCWATPMGWEGKNHKRKVSLALPPQKAGCAATLPWELRARIAHLLTVSWALLFVSVRRQTAWATQLQAAPTADNERLGKALTPLPTGANVYFAISYVLLSGVEKENLHRRSPLSWARGCSGVQSSRHNPDCLGFCFTSALLLGCSPNKQQPGWFSQLACYLVAKDFLQLWRALSKHTNAETTDWGCALGLPTLHPPLPPACARPVVFAFVDCSFPVPPLAAPLATFS